VTRGRLVVHGHFYQPSRADPFSGRTPPEPTAAPYLDWTSRIDAEAYRPNAERGNFARISWDLGPTLAAWLADHDRETYRRIVEQDAGAADTGSRTGMAQGYHHAILPLASAEDRRTEVRWGIRDFELRFGHRPSGLWLPETAVDGPTLRVLADEGIAHTILAPWQAEGELDTRQPYRVDLGDGRSITVVFYDATLSAAVSFEPAATADADRFARDRVAPRLTEPGAVRSDGAPADAIAPPVPPPDSSTVVIATDGELYGHHQPFRDLFLERLVAPAPEVPDRGFDVLDLESALATVDASDLPAARVLDRTSWSCHHGVLRWTAECPDVPDGRWKGPLRQAFDRLAAGIDAVTDRAFDDLAGRPDRVAARDGYVDVVFGRTEPERFARAHLAEADAAGRRRFLDLLEAQRWRLAMFASDGWFWDDPDTRLETRQVMRAAAKAARLVDALLDTGLEPRLVADLALLRSPATGRDGAAIYRSALEEVGQPADV
jgi:hypothetical protein